MRDLIETRLANRPHSAELVCLLGIADALDGRFDSAIERISRAKELRFDSVTMPSWQAVLYSSNTRSRCILYNLAVAYRARALARAEQARRQVFKRVTARKDLPDRTQSLADAFREAKRHYRSAQSPGELLRADREIEPLSQAFGKAVREEVSREADLMGPVSSDVAMVHTICAELISGETGRYSAEAKTLNERVDDEVANRLTRIDAPRLFNIYMTSIHHEWRAPILLPSQRAKSTTIARCTHADLREAFLPLELPPSKTYLVEYCRVCKRYVLCQCVYESLIQNVPFLGELTRDRIAFAPNRCPVCQGKQVSGYTIRIVAQGIEALKRTYPEAYRFFFSSRDAGYYRRHREMELVRYWGTELGFRPGDLCEALPDVTKQEEENHMATLTAMLKSARQSLENAYEKQRVETFGTASRRGKRWTQEEVAFARGNYPLMSVDDIAGRLGRSTGAVQEKIRDLIEEQEQQRWASIEQGIREKAIQVSVVSVIDVEQIAMSLHCDDRVTSEQGDEELEDELYDPETEEYVFGVGELKSARVIRVGNHYYLPAPYLKQAIQHLQRELQLMETQVGFFGAAERQRLKLVLGWLREHHPKHFAE